MFFLILFSIFGFAQNTALDSHLKIESQPLKVVSAITNPNVTAGSRMPVTLKVTLTEGYSAYEDKLKILPLSPDGLQASDIEVKPLVEFMDFSHKKHRGIQNQAELQFFVELPAKFDGPVNELLFDLQYVACTQKICLPLTLVKVSVPVNSPKTKMKDFSIEQQIESNLFLAFILVFAFGFLTSLTPCVYPLIPITLAVIGARSAKKTTAFAISLVYVFGIAMTYSVLGVAAAKTGALFGHVLSYPPVIIGFAIIFFLMALSLFGLFEIRAPHFVTQKLASRKHPDQKGVAGFVGVFVTGLIAGVIASPCVGPVLVGILAYIAKTQDGVLGFFLLFTFAMGMGVLFIMLGTFSSLLKSLPRSGKWMDRVKIILGVVMLGVSFYYIRPLLPDGASVQPGTTTSAKKLQNGWQLYSDELLARAKTEGKPVIIDFFADWCAACVELDEKTFNTPEFIEFSKKFVLLKVDGTENFKGLPELQKKYEVYGFPTVVFINKQGEFLNKTSLTGFENADKFLIRAEGVLK